MTTELCLRAHAKINLTLDVGARRPDGYHDIRSVMQTVLLHDTLTVVRTPDRPGVTLEIFGEEASGVPADESNLVHRAAVRLQKVAAARGAAPAGALGLHLRLQKRIPSRAGLGGGSSDAAAALRAVTALLGLGLSEERLTRIGAELGADVPFFLTGGTALVEGLGEQVTPLAPLAPHWDLLIARPAVGVGTAAAYAALDAMPRRAPGSSTAAWLAGRPQIHNDFWPVAAQVPEIAALSGRLREAAEREPETPPLLCGSGSCVFCRVTGQGAGETLAARLRRTTPGKYWVTRTGGGDR